MNRRGAWPSICAASVALVILATLMSCGGSEPTEADDPSWTALQLFEVARNGQHTEEQLARLFGADRDGSGQAALLEALAALEEISMVEVLGTEALSDLDRVVVDLAASLPAGGTAHYSVQLEQSRPGEWKIRWFQGPGVEWPRLQRPRGEGLTTSSLPAGEGAP